MQNTIAPLQQAFLKSDFERLCSLTFASAERVMPVFMLTQEMQEAIWITSSPRVVVFRARMSGDLTAAVYEFFEQCGMHFGFSEEDIGGVGMLMGDAVVQFKAVAFRGDRLTVELGLKDVERRTYDLIYRVTRQGDGAVVALAKTGMVAFDYAKNRLADLPAAFLEKTGAKPA